MNNPAFNSPALIEIAQRDSKTTTFVFVFACVQKPLKEDGEIRERFTDGVRSTRADPPFWTWFVDNPS